MSFVDVDKVTRLNKYTCGVNTQQTANLSYLLKVKSLKQLE